MFNNNDNFKLSLQDLFGYGFLLRFTNTKIDKLLCDKIPFDAKNMTSLASITKTDIDNIIEFIFSATKNKFLSKGFKRLNGSGTDKSLTSTIKFLKVFANDQEIASDIGKIASYYPNLANININYYFVKKEEISTLVKTIKKNSHFAKRLNNFVSENNYKANIRFLNIFAEDAELAMELVDKIHHPKTLSHFIDFYYQNPYEATEIIDLAVNDFRFTHGYNKIINDNTEIIANLSTLIKNDRDNTLRVITSVAPHSKKQAMNLLFKNNNQDSLLPVCDLTR